MGFTLAAVYLLFARPTVSGLFWGAVVALAGVALRAWSAGYLAKNRRLATAGPYAYTRNPLYLGSAIAGIGFCIAGGRWWFFLLLGTFLTAVYWPVIRREEAYLRELFAHEFDAYARSVPVLLPRLSRPAHPRDPLPRFDWQLYRQNRESEALLAYGIILLLLFGKMIFLGGT